MSGLHPRFQNKSADEIAFDLYLRTGRRVSPEFVAEILERKFNPYHDPDDGRFTTAAMGVDYGGYSAVQATQPRSGSAKYPVRVELPPHPQVRIKLPVSKPTPIMKHFSHNPGIDLPDEVVTKANELSDAVKAATGHQIHVTSGRRGPARQADAMYNNYLHPPGPRYVNKAAEAEVHRAFNEGRKKGLSRDQIIIAMADVLSRQTRRGIYLSRHMRSNAIDIRTPPAEVLRVIRNHPMVQSVLQEDDHIHIQFK